MNDDLYPNDGQFFGGVPLEPIDQAIERKQEKAKSLEKENILQDLLERWQEKIKFYESVRAIPEEVKLDPETFMRAVSANAVIVEVLEAELQYIESLIVNKSR